MTESVKKREERYYFPEVIDDDIIKKAGSNSISSYASGRVLVIDSNGNIIFKTSRIDKYLLLVIYILCFSIFLIILLLAVALPVIQLLSGDMDIMNIINHPTAYLRSFGSYLQNVILFLILVSPIMFLWLYDSSKIFDFENGYFYGLKYRKRLSMLVNDEKFKNEIIPISNIYALQILSRWSRWKTLFELNMILNNSNRVSLSADGDWREKIKNAEFIAERLGIKIWDIT